LCKNILRWIAVANGRHALRIGIWRVTVDGIDIEAGIGALRGKEGAVIVVLVDILIGIEIQAFRGAHDGSIITVGHVGGHTIIGGIRNARRNTSCGKSTILVAGSARQIRSGGTAELTEDLFDSLDILKGHGL
jgi:hypothetical protein